MSEKTFKASNGETVHVDSYGAICIDGDVACERTFKPEQIVPDFEIQTGKQ